MHKVYPIAIERINADKRFEVIDSVGYNLRIVAGSKLLVFWLVHPKASGVTGPMGLVVGARPVKLLSEVCSMVYCACAIRVGDNFLIFGFIM